MVLFAPRKPTLDDFDIVVCSNCVSGSAQDVSEFLGLVSATAYMDRCLVEENEPAAPSTYVEEIEPGFVRSRITWLDDHAFTHVAVVDESLHAQFTVRRSQRRLLRALGASARKRA